MFELSYNWSNLSFQKMSFVSKFRYWENISVLFWLRFFMKSYMNKWLRGYYSFSKKLHLVTIYFQSYIFLFFVFHMDRNYSITQYFHCRHILISFDTSKTYSYKFFDGLRQQKPNHKVSWVPSLLSHQKENTVL